MDKQSQLVQLVYSSKPTDLVYTSVIEFVPTAQLKNSEFNITGIILTHANFYLQLIEGERAHINQLYSNLIKDKRHTELMLLRYTTLREREFDNWSMAHIASSDLDSGTLGVVKPDEIQHNQLSGLTAMMVIRRIYALLTVTKGE